MKDLRGKVAVVTGAGSGIGRAIALSLAAEGVTVAAVDIDLDSAKNAAADIAASGGEASAHRADVSSEAEVRSLREEVLAAHHVVDILINNAGITNPPAQLVDTDLADVRRILEI